MDAAFLTATAAAAALARGELGAEELVRACLSRIDLLEPGLGAWIFLDREHALRQAREADLRRKLGKPLGPLHGIPVGVKDVFDTADMPTENGTPLHAGRRPREDAAVVALLRRAGAVILGKTVTTELAVYAPGKTTNPHDPARTPGGSSSGSAAAVAAAMVPLALGTQTNGSTIRPASYCGVYGYKPSRGLVSRTGVLRQSRALDQVGLFARALEDLALAAEPLLAFDPRDPDMRPEARPRLLETLAGESPVPPRLAFVKSPVWNEASADTRAGFAELVSALGGQVHEVGLPNEFDEAVEVHRTIFEADLARSFAPEYERGADRLSGTLREMIARGRQTLALDYNRAVDRIPILVALLDEVLHLYDAILTPATTGEAPLGLQSTGSPVFCTIWTLCGLPALSLPLLQGAAGLPIGAQLVGAPGDDARLLRTARWLVHTVALPATR
jgi:Asp-tRNA(Asn)/Glu-tRNA(Gln) amidotransferase A subunit family amidase